MDIKQIARDKMEVRTYAHETLTSVISWIQASKPSEWLPPAKDNIVPEDAVKAQWRDYVDKSGALISKVWRAGDLMGDDLVAFMEETCAKPKNSPEGKPRKTRNSKQVSSPNSRPNDTNTRT